MKMSILVEKLWLENKEFVSAETLREYCKPLGLDHESTIHYLSKRKHLVRIFNGIFYVRSLEEFKLGKSKYNHLELVAKGLELKGIKNWYFGLHTALKLNNMTHEHFTIEEVISDSLFRAKPVTIAGHKFRFIKLSPSLLKLGIVKEGLLRYSNPEKTLLDFIYLSRQDGVSNDRIIINTSSWIEGLDKEKIITNASNYPKTVVLTAEQAIV